MSHTWGLEHPSLPYPPLSAARALSRFLPHTLFCTPFPLPLYLSLCRFSLSLCRSLSLSLSLCSLSHVPSQTEGRYASRFFTHALSLCGCVCLLLSLSLSVCLSTPLPLTVFHSFGLDWASPVHEPTKAFLTALF